MYDYIGCEVTIVHNGNRYAGTVVNVNGRHILLDTHQGYLRMLSLELCENIEKERTSK